MLRNLIGWLLLAPMVLNGLWVVCEDVPAKAEASSVLQGLTEEEANCIQICAIKHRTVDAGVICFVLPGDSKTSITVFDFGVAIVAPEIQLTPAISTEEFATALPASYSNPSLANHTPPPKA
jgi:hypothetical protein